MLERVSVPVGYLLEDYERYAGFADEVATLREAAAGATRQLRGRTVWHLSSTAQGGGVAEMLPRALSLSKQAGIQAEWVVIKPETPAFFPLTKQLHNMLHGRDGGDLGTAARELYASVSHALATELAALIAPGDLVVVHDPQPLGAGALLKAEREVSLVWRCHVGLDHATPTTEAAWAFLRPWLDAYDHAVFSLPEYVPSWLRAKSTVIAPAIDPLSHKNRELSVHKLTGIMVASGLVTTTQPTLTAPFAEPARRLQPDGSFRPATEPTDLGLLFRPLVLQVSRWDRLKGFLPLLEAFTRLKSGPIPDAARPHDRQRLALVRLVLAGPDPAGVQDDPEALAVLEQLSAAWCALPAAIQADVALLALPMGSRKNNALMVNALQRCASVIVQNSLEEGFGLTVTEAMWKARPVLASQAAGIRAQIHDGVEGRLVADPEDREAIAATLADMLHDLKARETWALNGRRRVATELHILRLVTDWLRLYASQGLTAASTRAS